MSRSLVLLGRYARHGLYALLADRLMPNLRFLEGLRARLARALLQAEIGPGVTLNPYIDFGHEARFITLGAGCVIAAGVLVNKDVPPNELWGGVPARLIRKLEEWSTRLTTCVPLLPHYTRVRRTK